MKRRFVVISSALVVLAGVGIWWFGLRPPDTSSDQVSAADLRARRILGQSASLDADGVPLRDVIDQLAAKHGVEIVLDDDAIKQAAKDEGAQVTLSVSGISLRSLLTLACEQLWLAFLVRDGAIHITTRDALVQNYSNYVGTMFLLMPSDTSSDPLRSGTIACLIATTLAPVSLFDAFGQGEVVYAPGAVAVVDLPDRVERVEHLVAEVERWQANPDSTEPFWVDPPTLENNERSRRVWRKLREPVSFTFSKAPLDEVCRRLSHQCGIPILIDVRAFDDWEFPITLTLNDVTLGAALRLILDDSGLTYCIRNEVLQIVELDEYERSLPTRAYPVADLESEPLGLDRDSLMDLITTTVEPDFRDFITGDVTVEIELPGLLLIRTTSDAHERIEQRLLDLRRFLDPLATLDEPRELLLSYPKVNPKILHALEATTSLRFDETPLMQIASDLSEQHGINVVVDGAAYDGHMVGTDIALTGEVDNQPLGVALDQILGEYLLAIVVQENWLRITSAEEAEDHWETRCFDTRRLCDPDFGSLDIHELTDLITNVVFPDTWYRAGYPPTATSVCDVLVVSHHPWVHQAVESFLRFLEENADGLPAVSEVEGRRDAEYRAELADELVNGSIRWRRAYACLLFTRSDGDAQKTLDVLLEAFVGEDIYEDSMLRSLVGNSICDLIRTCNTGAITALESRISSETNVECRKELIGFLENCGNDAIVPLIGLLDSEDGSDRNAACAVLVSFRSRAVPSLLETLERAPSTMIWNTLNRIDPRGELRLQTLLEWYESDDEQTRRSAAVVRRRLDPLQAPLTSDAGEIERLLQQLLADEKNRDDILQRLREIDSDGKRGREILYRWYENDDEHVRRRAAEVRRVLGELQASGSDPFAPPTSPGEYPFVR